MNTDLSTMIATERRQRLVHDAAEYRRGRTSRKIWHAKHHHTRVSALVKDIVPAAR